MRVRRPVLSVILVLALLAPPFAGETQVSGAKAWRIGFLEAGASSANHHFLDAFKRGLGELGYVEGQNLTIEERWADGQNERFPPLLAQLIRLKVDLIVQASTPGALAAKAATTTIPVVFVGVIDPVRNRLVDSLGRPSGNLTGFSLADELGLFGKRLELLKETVPKVARVAVLWNPTVQGFEARMKETHTPATTLRLTLQPFEAREVNQFDGVFAAMTRAHMDGLIVLADPFPLRYRTRIVDLAATSRLPAVYAFGEFVRAGGVMAYGASVSHLFYRAAT